MEERQRQANAPGGRPVSRKVKLTEVEDLSLSALAARAGMTVQRFLVESALLLDQNETITDRRELLTTMMLLRREVAAVGNNVNQIAHVANATGEIQPHLADEVTTLRGLVRRIDRTLEQLAVPAGRL